jgi:hypothetical protein
MYTAGSRKMLVNSYKSAPCHSAEDHGILGIPVFFIQPMNWLLTLKMFDFFN